MQVLLLGTGAADGWPNAWCTCASCAWARRTGTVRGTTAALVDGVLLIDAGPDTARQAAEAGVSLAGVRAVLLTHAHPDHVAGETFLARSWAGTPGPLHVLGPTAALDACREWVAPRDDVRFEPLTSGARVEVEGYAVHALAAAHESGGDVLGRDALLFDVTAPDGSRLLHATDTGPLPETTVAALRDRPLGLLLLEETFGRITDHGTGHLDLRTFPRELARLRRVGVVDASTDVVAVHLGHHNPPGDELDRTLAAWGARTVPDGTVLEVGSHRTASPAPTTLRTLLVGGARSGKSREAESRLLSEPHVRYVATGGARADDPEWRARVAQHRARRPTSWTTVESLEIAALLRDLAPGEPALVDCLALWLAGQLDSSQTWEAVPGTPAYAETLAQVDRAVDDLVAAVRTTRGRVVLVTNEVGSGVVPEHASGRLYRDLLGTLNARVAAQCDEVALVVAGRVVPL